MEWLSNNWEHLLAGYGALVAFVSVVVKLTPTPKDDEFLAALLKKLELFSVVKKTTKQ